MRASLIPTLYAKDVESFMNLIAKRNDLWHQNPTQENFWVYRGQFEERGKKVSLIPSSLRKQKAYQSVKQKILAETQSPFYATIDTIVKNITKKVQKESHKKNRKTSDDPFNFYFEKIAEKTRKNFENLILQSMIELTLLQRFVETCNKSALYIDDSHVTIECKISDRYFKIKEEEAKFKLKDIAEAWLAGSYQESLYGIKNPNPFFHYTNYYPLALAQHSGIPSRLLDWTYHPFIAAFFALPKSYQLSQGDLCVYAFNLQYQRDPLLYRNALRIHANTKRHRFDFLHAQKGIFIEMRGADFYYLNHGKWPSLEEHILEFDEYASQEKDLYNLKKIVLSGEFANELRKQLAEEDITQSILMPTYFHCAEQVMGK